jgi:tetratricopeptide (TPR) repeat protein
VGQGRWHLWKNEPESAVTALQKAIAIAPKDREANFFLGRALTEANRLEEAAEVFRRTELSNRTEDFNFLTHTAWANLEAARLNGPRAPEWEKAERYYQVTRLLFPDDWRHWRNTADFYLYYRLDEDRGIELLRHAEEAFPKSILPHLEAARYLGRKSRRAELLGALRRAVARKPDNPEIFESAYEVLREEPSLGLPEWLLLARRGLGSDNGIRARFEELQKRVKSAESGGRAE